MQLCERYELTKPKIRITILAERVSRVYLTLPTVFSGPRPRLRGAAADCLMRSARRGGHHDGLVGSARHRSVFNAVQNLDLSGCPHDSQQIPGNATRESLIHESIVNYQYSSRNHHHSRLFVRDTIEVVAINVHINLLSSYTFRCCVNC